MVNYDELQRLETLLASCQDKLARAKHNDITRRVTLAKFIDALNVKILAIRNGGE